MASVKSKLIPPLGKADSPRFWTFVQKTKAKDCWL